MQVKVLPCKGLILLSSAVTLVHRHIPLLPKSGHRKPAALVSLTPPPPLLLVACLCPRTGVLAPAHPRAPADDGGDLRLGSLASQHGLEDEALAASVQGRLVHGAPGASSGGSLVNLHRGLGRRVAGEQLHLGAARLGRGGEQGDRARASLDGCRCGCRRGVVGCSPQRNQPGPF